MGSKLAYLLLLSSLASPSSQAASVPEDVRAWIQSKPKSASVPARSMTGEKESCENCAMLNQDAAKPGGQNDDVRSPRKKSSAQDANVQD